MCLTLASAVGFADKNRTMYHAFTSNTLLALPTDQRFPERVPEHPGRAEYVGDALNRDQAAVTAVASDLAWLHCSEHSDNWTGDLQPLETFISGPSGLSEEELNDFFHIANLYGHNYDGNWWGLQ